MPARAIWKGVLALGDDIELPVKLYSAVQDRTVHFRLLDSKDRQPVAQEMVEPETEEEVAAKEIRKGAEVEPGVFVLLKDDEVEKLEPPASRIIQIERFLNAGEISHLWYERPYYLGPDEGGDREYWDFVEALERTEKEGVARWVMRKRRYLGSLKAIDGFLMLITLRFADEVITAEDLTPPPGRDLDAKEVTMARRLVEAMAGEFDPGEFHDEFRARVLELIEAKKKGKKIRARKPERKPRPESLAGALQASLAAARKR
ncbi:MAG: Ku protein [Candidatus Eisenbacteria bacterium]|nr:Ku protein [Candidatus Eisenbacteria bacterium]